jgi:mxaA protein
MIPWVVIALVLGFAAGGAAPARAASVTAAETRPFGYFLGDVIRRDLTIRIGPGESLDMASLPRPGPVNYWLELGSADLVEGRNGDEKLYRLTLVYQTFYAPLDTRKLTIPGFKLKVDGPSGAQELSVPEFGFTTSPLRQLFSEKGDTAGSATALRPDHIPQRLPTGRERTALLVAGVLALASLVGLAWHNAWWPFHRRPSRPFTEAARFIRTHGASLNGVGGYRTALLKLHRAFDLAAGRRVLADDVAEFLGQHPEFSPYAAEVERMFASSREAFFADDVARARATMPIDAIAELGDRLGAAERRAA